ncbi:hypothetical protein RRG08_003706 [Elysia crispata]|uniref:BTB domain-containing protein n=1 Tax=Elysia crispata TaxID=231223 RepID=A0AAE1AWB7_9GAST|nr:hypothetical protein RRG08_003706 [Elysia crispata]
MNSDQTKMSKPESVEKLEPLTWTPEKRFQTHPTDMTLVIDQHVFRVHKEILKASSDYFQAMFSSGMQENEKDSITLRLVPFEPFQTILLGFYSGTYLVVDEEIDVFEAIKKWVMKSKASNQNLSVNLMRKLIASSICLKNSEKDLEGVMSLILDESRHFTHEEVLEVLGKRERHEDVFMFWSLLNTTTADGLVDIVKLCQDGQGVKVGTMTDVVERPGYDLGSAFCVHGCCVYLSGGGPSFGKVNWIRKLYKYDLSKILSQWEPIGDLYETRRHHAMIAVGSKLYIFGGFGKFRTKNLKLDCFDTLSGVWEALPATPSHEIKPVATTDQRSIFYMDRTHNVHCFDITSCHWSSFSTPAPARSSLPVAIFAVKQEPGSLMAVLDSANVFTLPS